MTNFSSFWGKSPRSVRGAFYKALPFFFVVCLILGACSNGNDDVFVDDHKLNNNLLGTWASEYDGYTITATTLVFNDGGYGLGFTGTIEYVINFSPTAGVIIVKYTTARPTYYTPAGDYMGVYFKDLAAATAKIGSAYSEQPVETTTLEEAKQKFVNASDYGGELTMAAVQQKQQ